MKLKFILIIGLLILVGYQVQAQFYPLGISKPATAPTTPTFTYNFTTGACVKTPSGTCNAMSSVGVCNGTVTQNNAALAAFNVEAQRHTRPSDTGFSGGYCDPTSVNGSGCSGDGTQYSDANINNQIVLNIPACNKFQHTYNRFGAYIRNLTVTGAGSTNTFLQNTSNSTNYLDAVPYFGNMDYFGSAAATGNQPNYGYFINQAEIGATSVTLFGSPANAGNFYVGRWVMIWSYMQDWFGGYPPDPRYYDFAQVTAVNPGTGVITFDTPLTFQHRHDTPYTGTLTDATGSTGTWGPARITAIDTPNKPVAFQNYSGIHAVGNPNWNASGISQLNGDLWIFGGLIDGGANDLISDYAMQFGQLRDVTVSNSTWQWDEADKIIRTLVYDHDTVTTTLGHTGELTWHVKGGHIGTAGGPGEGIGARHLIFDSGTLIDGMLSTTNFTAGIQLDMYTQTVDVSVDSATFKGNNNTNNAPINAPPVLSITVDGTQVTSVTGPNGPNTRLQVIKDLGSSCNPAVGSNYHPSNCMVDYWGVGAAVMKNGSFVSGASVTLISGDASFIYVDITGATFATNDTVWAARVGSISVTNSIGQSTGYSWTGCGMIRYPSGGSVPVTTCSGNSGT